jgi:hypothetical protein
MEAAWLIGVRELNKRGERDRGGGEAFLRHGAGENGGIYNSAT